MELFHYHPDTATASTFNQQREKILPEALEFLFREFNKAFLEHQTYRGYQLLACDGTDLNIARNPNDQETYFQSNPGEKGFNQLHLNAMYDLYRRSRLCILQHLCPRSAAEYAIGLSCFHAKKVEYIHQEIFARLILYNFCEIITTHVVVKQKETKHSYQVNYTLVIHICRHFLRFHTDISPPGVKMLLQKNLLPVRPGRSSDPRKVKHQSFVSFLYRVA